MTRNHYFDYASHRFQQLGSKRCACGRVARDVQSDRKTGKDKHVCLVCSGHYTHYKSEKARAQENAAYQSRAA